MLVTSNLVVSDVKRMIVRWRVRVFSSFNYESVRFVPNDVHFRYQQAINIPTDAPTNMTLKMKTLALFQIKNLNAIYR